DHRGREPPPVANRVNLVEPRRSDDREHPLLRLGREDLERLQPGLPERYRIELHLRSDAAARRGLADSTRQAGAAQVLEALQQTGLHELEARLDQELLRERVPDLDGGTAAVR